MERAENRKYHYIYKTTCLVTGRYYVGMHSSDTLDDGYKGSGTKLWHSMNKYGKDNHVVEILEFLPTRKALREREQEIVNESFLADDKVLNLRIGGSGFRPIRNEPMSDEWKKKISEKLSSKAPKTFTLTSPQGETYTSRRFAEFRDQCIALGISYKAMYKAYSLNRPPRYGKSKGWSLAVKVD